MTLSYALTSGSLSELQEVKDSFNSSRFQKEKQLIDFFHNFYHSVFIPNIDDLTSFLDGEFEKGSFKIFSFDNIQKMEENKRSDRFYIQTFLTSADRNFNPLVDPYYLIEGYIDTGIITFKSCDFKGKEIVPPMQRKLEEISEISESGIANEYVSHFSKYVIYTLKKWTNVLKEVV